MAGARIFMQITPVDSENNLFKIENIFSQDLVNKVLSTDWLSLPWQRQEGQELWARRRVQDHALPWIDQWHQELSQRWSEIEQQLGSKLHPYFGTAFWVDEPGFTCGMHTDGELPGSLHINWVGPGTTFYWYKDPATVRYQVPLEPNSGYIMINRHDDTGYRKLLWHAMLTPVETFRVTSYTWITP
jgi:hypothetical protein